MALSDIIGRLLEPLLRRIKEALGPFGKIFDILSKFWNNLTHVRENIQKLVDSIKGEIDAFRNFKEDVSFRTRVINLPKAIDRTQEFLQTIRSGWDSIVELWKELHTKLEPAGNPTEEAEQAIQDIEQSGFKDIIKKFPKLLKGAEKVLGFVVIIADALESILTVIEDLQKIVDTVKAIREEIETGSTIFLQNKNARKTLKLKAGGSIRIRVGSLHS